MAEPLAPCDWCDGACADVDLTAVLAGPADWFWSQLADAGDQRGDPDLVTGTVTVTAPADPAERAAIVGWLGGRIPGNGQRVRVTLADLVARLQTHDHRLTPGMVAAHSTGRRLGERTRLNAERRNAVEGIRQTTVDAFASGSGHVRPDLETVWPHLRRAGWAARLLAAGNPDQIIGQAAAIIAALPPPPQRLDRRLLADTVTGNPHALDSGTLPGLVLAILGRSDAVPTGVPTRQAWAAVGVDCDDLTGGLLAMGIVPDGWSLPPGTVVTIPPRELVRCQWPPPRDVTATVFVTENPSVVTAAADLVPSALLLCTVGTPSAREIEALGRLATAGWTVAARADFDLAGLQHVAAVLHAVPGSRPWRMDAHGYLDSLSRMSTSEPVRLGDRELPDTPWDPGLRRAMSEHGLAAYEETLIDILLRDLAAKS